MHWKFIAKTVGILLVLLGVSMLVPLGTGLYYHETDIRFFIEAIGATMLTGAALLLVSRGSKSEDFISQKEGMATVAIAWTAVTLMGALPFYLSPEFSRFSALEPPIPRKSVLRWSGKSASCSGNVRMFTGFARWYLFRIW